VSMAGILARVGRIDRRITQRGDRVSGAVISAPTSSWPGSALPNRRSDRPLNLEAGPGTILVDPDGSAFRARSSSRAHHRGLIPVIAVTSFRSAWSEAGRANGRPPPGPAPTRDGPERTKSIRRWPGPGIRGARHSGDDDPKNGTSGGRTRGEKPSAENREVAKIDPEGLGIRRAVAGRSDLSARPGRPDPSGSLGLSGPPPPDPPGPADPSGVRRASPTDETAPPDPPALPDPGRGGIGIGRVIDICSFFD
jgi:hypothetical protein